MGHLARLNENAKRADIEAGHSPAASTVDSSVKN